MTIINRSGKLKERGKIEAHRFLNMMILCSMDRNFLNRMRGYILS